jgi:molybdenum cofactor biosynthesis protein B
VEREFIPINIGILRVLETGAMADEAEVEAIVGELANAGHQIVAQETVTDSKSLIREQLTMWIGDRGIDCVVAIGGADSTPTDPMLDALAPLVTRQFFGFGELFRAIVHEEAGTASIFSHAEAALCNSTYVILLPASGFTRPAIERLLIPQLDCRTRPRNLAMSLPRFAGVPQEQMGGDTPPSQRMTRPPPFPRGASGMIPVADRTQPMPAPAVKPAPPPPPSGKKSTQQMPVVPAVAPPPAAEPPAEPPVTRRPATEPGVAPIPKAEEPARNAFADALQAAATQRRTASVVAQLPKPPPEPAPEPKPASKVVDLGTVDLKALDETKDGALTLSTSTSGTINMDALVAEAEPVAQAKPAPRVTAPPPFVPRKTASVPVVNEPAPVAAVAEPEPKPPADLVAIATRTPTVAPPTKPSSSGDFEALANKPPERKTERVMPMQYKEGRRRRDGRRTAVIVLLLLAGASVIAAAVVVAMSVMHDKRAQAKAPPPPPPPTNQVVIEEPPDAAIVPLHDPVVADAAEIEMPVETPPPVDASPLALRPPVPNHPVPQHDPVAPPDAAVKPMQDDGCDEVSCVLDHYERECCAPFKPKTPENPGMQQDLDRASVAKSIESMKAVVITCGQKFQGKGQVRVHLAIAPDGHVTSADVESSPSAGLGACVAEALRRVQFKHTANGGEVTYPYNF